MPGMFSTHLPALDAELSFTLSLLTALGKLNQ